MASRDFGFITLRNIAAYQGNGNPVPPNQVLVTSGTGNGGFTSTLTINTICVSTVEVSSIFIDREAASSINTNFLTVNSTTSLSTTTINNTLALIGNTPADSEIWLHNYKSRLGTSDPYGGLYLEASTTTSIWFSNIDATAGPYAQIGQGQSAVYGSLNVTSTINVSTLNTKQISTSNITTNFVSTFNHIALFDGTSSVILDAQGSTLYVNGHPIISGGGISSVSSLFWLPGPNGTIYNENIGTLPGNYNLVGIGTAGAALTATLDVAGTTRVASSLTVSSILNAQNIKTTSISAPSPSNQYFIDYTQSIDSGTLPYPVLRFNSLKAGGTQNKSLTLLMGDGVATWTSQWETFLMQDMKFVCQDFWVSSIQDINLESQSTIYLDTPETFVSNQLYASSLSTPVINMSSLGTSNGQIIGLSTINGIAWPPVDDALWSGSISGNIYNDNSANVGIGTNTPAYKLDVFGEARYYSTFQNSTFTLLLENQGATSTSTEIYMATGNGAYGLYATQSGGSPIGTGLIPSTFQIYSYYSNPLNIFTLYPNGIVDLYNNLNITSGYVSTNTIEMNNGSINGTVSMPNGLALTGNVAWGSLKIQSGPTENAIFIRDANTPVNVNNGYLIGNSNNFTSNISTLVIGRTDAIETNKGIFLTQTGNVGIGNTNPQFTLDVSGNTNIASTLYASTISLNSTSTVVYKNSNPADSNNLAYYQYLIALNNGTNGNINGTPADWNAGTYVTISATGNPYKDSLLTAVATGLPNTGWVCPLSGLWQVTMNVEHTGGQPGAIVLGNLTTNEPYVTNGNTTSVYIRQGDTLLCCGYYSNGVSVGGTDITNSYLLFKLIYPLNTTSQP